MSVDLYIQPLYPITIAFPIGPISARYRVGDWRVAIATWKVYVDANPPVKSNTIANYGKTWV